MKDFLRTFWRSSERHFIYSRWTFLVLINALLPFLFSLEIITSISILLGITLAVSSFVIIYAELESWLLLKYCAQLARQLKVSAALKITTCLLPFIDLITGSISMELARWLTGINFSTPHKAEVIDMSQVAISYITTMIDGFLLSMIVAFIMLLINTITKLRHSG